MTNDLRVNDTDVRERAVREISSFIVQAPAGSGKTELLTQRYLHLLATVDEPEEIVAITFTRKAAGEMQQRILEAIGMATGPEPDEPHRQMTYALARAACKRDLERGWHIAEHPARLRIQTIDSFNAMLTRQMPLLAQFGSQPGISEQPEKLYLEAAERCLRTDDESDLAYRDAVQKLLLHADNDLPRARTLLVGMLKKRDQWLEPLGGLRVNRELLQASLQREIGHQLVELDGLLPPELRDELEVLTQYAYRQLRDSRLDQPGYAKETHPGIPGTKVGDLQSWQFIAGCLLTKQGQWRKNVDVRVGFPPKDDGEKARAQEMLVRLAGFPLFEARLHACQALPGPEYSEAQWAILDALLFILPRSVAQLLVVFGEQGEVDYPELALRALSALGNEDRPSDLALSLDYRISHLLVDEFQDTSSNQLALLERLTSGWERGDGRTMFLVGDPMQSIYRFREAEVGLFLRARKEGIGQIELHPLVLNVNFRSQAGIVDWVNDVFSEVLPANEDIAAGAVPYSASVAKHAALPGPAVSIHPGYDGDAAVEADRVLAIVKEAQADSTNASTAILVSSRTHLADIVPRLRQAGIRFRAVEIERLRNRPVVQDILALTRALYYDTDRTAWLSILRAPWCGLTLAELHALVANDTDTAVFELLQSGRLDRIPEAARIRVDRVIKSVDFARQNRRRLAARELVESTWIRLGGPACLRTVADLDDADAFFALIESLEIAGDLPDTGELLRELEKLYAHADDSAPDALQIMTMHKAKGLEFDTVILPGLGRKTRGDDPQLLQWIERPREHGSDLLLATITETGTVRDPVYDFLTTLQREKHRHEQGRLLYVAATRTRKRLHLLGDVAVRETKTGPAISKPADNTLLARLWPKLAPIFTERFENVESHDHSQPLEIRPTLSRLPAEFRLPDLEADVDIEKRTRDVAAGSEAIDYFWAGETARHVGTVVHTVLQRIADEGASSWDEARTMLLPGLLKRKLAELGVATDELQNATTRAVDAVERTLTDETGNWLLSATHDQAAAELRLSGVIDKTLYNVSIDRTFVDEQGTRWIVDYKTSVHEGGDINVFLANERNRYRQQLHRYATLMRDYSDHPVRVGLYFPLLGKFDHWDPFEEPVDDETGN